MGKVKIHEIAKNNGMASKDVLEIANKLKIEVKSHLSGVTGEEASKIEKMLGNKKSDVDNNIKKKENQKMESKKDEKPPVIIRRDVVINKQEDVNEKPKEVKKNKEPIFVERDKNKDFNLVYRNKQAKPMTVSDLFGMNKASDSAEQAKQEQVVEEKPKTEPVKEEGKVEAKPQEQTINPRENNTERRPQYNNNGDRPQYNNNNNNGYRNNNGDRPQYNNGDRPQYNNNNGYRNNNGDRPQYNNNNGYRNNNGDRPQYNNNGDRPQYNNNNGYRNNNGDRPQYNNNNGYRNNNGDRPQYNNNGDRPQYNNNNGYRNNNGDRPQYNNNNGYRNNNGDRPQYNNGDRPQYNNNNGYRNNNGDRPQYNNNNGYRNNNGDRPQYNNNNGYRNNNGDRPQYNNNNGYRNNNGDRPQYNNNNGYRNNNGYNNNGGYNNGQRKPYDNTKRLEKDIQDIVAADVIEKEVVRDYSKNIDKQKLNNKYEDKNKKTKNRKNSENASFDEGKIKSLKQADGLSKMFDSPEGGMLDYYDLSTNRGRKRRRNQKNDGQPSKQKIFKLTNIEIPETITVKDLATEMKITSGDVIKKLIGLGIMATINNELDFDTAFLIAEEYGIKAAKKQVVTEEDILFDDSDDDDTDLAERPPVVVVMGHVDHGKTSLLDVVRKTNVIEGEAGGITQAIGAYKVKVQDREITFLDTPGHEAFTSMRSRGASITDIAILVVAANDGVMPQTIEAINHAKDAGIPIIVAVNKIDLPDANIDKVKQELMAYELVSEEWGGDTIFVPISAKQNQNIDQLLEMVLLQADVLELKANHDKQSKGTVIEARLDKSKGPVVTMLVQRGKLDIGDTIIVGSSIGRIRTMIDDKGRKVKKAGPSTPVEITGLTIVPEAGDTFYEVKNEKVAKALIEKRKYQAREEVINSHTKITLDNLFSKMEEGTLKQLNLIIKADVQGSVEAVKQSLEKLKNEEVKVRVIHSGAGAVNQSDVTLAKVSGAIIIAFNVRPDATAREMADKDEIEIKQYSVIYKAIEDVEAALKGMLTPKFEEKVIGNVEIREVFKISNVGSIAGSYVLTGKVERNAGVRVIRENVVLHEGKLCTLKRFKDDVKEVSKGFECGIQIEAYNDIAVGDNIEVFIMEEIKR